MDLKSKEKVITWDTRETENQEDPAVWRWDQGCQAPRIAGRGESLSLEPLGSRASSFWGALPAKALICATSGLQIYEKWRNLGPRQICATGSHQIAGDLLYQISAMKALILGATHHLSQEAWYHLHRWVLYIINSTVICIPHDRVTGRVPTLYLEVLLRCIVIILQVFFKNPKP